MARREAQEKELRSVLSKEIGAKNPIFSQEHIVELHALFCLYADPHQNRAELREMLFTAGNLGLDHKFQLVFRMLEEVQNSTRGSALDFEQFLREITNHIGHPFSEEGRRQHFALLDIEGKTELDFNTLRYVCDQLRYGYSEDQLLNIIHAVGGHTASTISFDHFNRFVQRRVEGHKIK